MIECNRNEDRSSRASLRFNITIKIPLMRFSTFFSDINISLLILESMLIDNCIAEQSDVAKINLYISLKFPDGDTGLGC